MTCFVASAFEQRGGQFPMKHGPLLKKKKKHHIISLPVGSIGPGFCMFLLRFYMQQNNTFWVLQEATCAAVEAVEAVEAAAETDPNFGLSCD